MQLAIMRVAEARLSDLLVSGRKTKIHSFKIASTPGVNPVKEGNTQPSGPLVYTGEANQIWITKVSLHEVVFTIRLEHTVGDFSIGNAMIYLESDAVGGQPIPFLWASLANATPKNDSDLPAYVVGNRIMLQCTTWFPYLTNALDFSPHEELVARLPTFTNDKALPGVDVAEYDQGVIGEHEFYDAGIMVAKDTKRGYWWGTAFTQYIEDPYLGNIRGGIVGQEYGSRSNIDYYDGTHYKLNNANFKLYDGGSNWITANESPLDGGLYSDTH